MITQNDVLKLWRDYVEFRCWGGDGFDWRLVRRRHVEWRGFTEWGQRARLWPRRSRSARRVREAIAGLKLDRSGGL